MIDGASPLRITVINLHSPRNVGDAALLEMTLVALQNAFSGCHITLAMNDPDPRYAERDPARVAVVRSFSALIGAHDTGRTLLGQAVAFAAIVVLGALAATWYRLFGWPPAWASGDFRALLTAYMHADLIASCPGNIFVSTGSVGKTLIVSALTVAYALVLGKPFYVLPQSMGPFRQRWMRRLTAALYGRARLVFAREPYSFRIGQEIGLPSDRLRLAPDLAFALPPAPPETAQAILAQYGLGASQSRGGESLGALSAKQFPSTHGIASVQTAGLALKCVENETYAHDMDDAPRLGVTVINRLLRYVDEATWERYESAMADVLRRFVREYGARVIFFPQVTGPSPREDDREAAKRVIAAMGHPSGAVLLEAVYPPATLKALCGQMDAFVATRMHSAIFALSMGVPTVMIEYLAKTRGLAEMLGLEAWRLELTRADAGQLQETLDLLWRDRFALRARLAETIPAFCAEAGAVGQAIAQDFRGR